MKKTLSAIFCMSSLLVADAAFAHGVVSSDVDKEKIVTLESVDGKYWSRGKSTNSLSVLITSGAGRGKTTDLGRITSDRHCLSLAYRAVFGHKGVASISCYSKSGNDKKLEAMYSCKYPSGNVNNLLPFCMGQKF